MIRYPIYVNGDISMQQLTDALRSAGLILRSDLGGRMVVDEPPAFLKKGADWEATKREALSRNVVRFGKVRR